MYDYTPSYRVWIERMNSFMRSEKTLEGTFEEHSISISPDEKKDAYNVKVDGWLVETSRSAEAVLSSLINAYEETIIEEEVEAEKEAAVELAKDNAKTAAVNAEKKPEDVAKAILEAAVKAEAAEYEVDPEEVTALVSEIIEEILYACEEE
ncbi:hypothetical protein [Halodesulfovibrio marinisediminis]|uniref:Uncharacterized protein n=1 Tax=Halodesulfovibrio marinisediminis DSM 17456 TaxID=1121457 RepID=A0A1N6HZI9_9BACT|nr:hypothetical protein [Halodesulfovibrio marinisediminis]SIO25223.1 hypothetical protein SAMN02745161_2304 [Halodesulfovibrio marinisediminis DSM 17456]